MAALGGVRWGVAPIRWWGLVALDLRSFSADGEPRRFHQSESAQLNVASYVWQPWFAQVSGGLGAVVSSERGGADSRSTGMTGHGAISVFPVSRFPFQANFDVSDTRASGEYVGQDYRTYRYGARQTYRSLEGANSVVSFDRSTLSGAFGRDTVDALNASHLRVLGRHSLEANASLTRNDREGSGERAEFRRLFGRHGYRDLEDRLLTVETLASYGASELRLGTLGTGDAARTDSFQLNSFFTWRPDEDDPLYVTGGARLSDTGTSFGRSEVESRSLMAHGAASYQVSRNLTVNGGGSVSHTSGTAGTAEGMVTTQFGGATYALDPWRFGEYVYTSSLAGNITNQTAPEQNRQLLSAQGTHGLQRPFLLGAAQSLNVGLTQTLGASHESVSGGLYTLAHNASASWSLSRADGLAGYVSVSAGDSRTFGYATSEFQLLNLQLSGQAQFGRLASLNANLTLQGTRQATGNVVPDGFDITTNGGVTYQHLRAFGVPQLRYSLTYNRSDYQFNTRLLGDLNAPREHVQWSLENRLDYRIGKLDARLSFRVAEIDGKKNALVFVRLARQIGDW